MLAILVFFVILLVGFAYEWKTGAFDWVRVLHQERAAEVRAGLNRLRTMDRETLEAFYMKGHSLVEMSHEFDSPIGTIKRRLHVARKRLAKELTETVA